MQSRMVASTCGIQSPSNRKVTLKAMDHENITKPMKGRDWRAPSPPVKVMDTSAVSSIFISQTKEMSELFLPTLNIIQSRMVASTCGIQSPSNRKVPLKAMDHENITKPMKGIDWRAPSPPVKVMDMSAVSSISISPTKERSEVFFTNIEHYKVKNGCFHVWNPEPEQSESDFKGNGSWK